MSSGCSLCAATGQCSTAYKNSPGQYCGNWFDVSWQQNKPCCCPLNSVCNTSPTQCMCHVQNTRSSNYGPTNNYAPMHPSYNGNYRQAEEAGGSGFIIFILIVICCCMCCRRGSSEQTHKHSCHDEHTPMARAYPVQTDQCPPSSNPDYHQYGAVNHGQNHGTAIASGLGGLAAGTLIGDMIGRNRSDAHNAPQYGGNFGGGYNIVGDSGDGGYNIAGDSGDGGYDIVGDS